MASRYRLDKDIKANPLNREEVDYRNMLVDQDAEKFSKMVGSDKQYALDVALRVADEIMHETRAQRGPTNVLDDREVV
jgi:hypothetical protein